MTNHRFIENTDELIDSTLEFHNKPEFWKAVLGSAPKYFVHITNNGKHIFGLSKFCAFKNITVENYLSTYREETNGTITQKHIAKVMDKHWISKNKIDSGIRQSFDNWISDFFPNYNRANALFIEVK